MTEKTKQTQQSDSIAEACLPFADLLGGPIVHLSFDTPKNLRTAFNSAAKANGTSACHVLRGFMQVYIVADHYRKACFPNTNKPVVIEKLVMPTYVKKRVRRYAVEEETEVTQTVSCCLCHKRAVAIYQHERGVQQYACESHSQFLNIQPEWTFFKKVPQ